MKPLLLHHRFERVAACHPDRTAVAAAGHAPLTYAALERASRALALRLRATGLEAGDRVGVWMRKSPAAVTALLAVSRASGVFVPLDPQSPPARIAALVADAGLHTLVADATLLPALTDAAGAPTLPSGMRLLPLPPGPCPDADAPAALAPAALAPDDLAYILYTSGSTGAPKGVMLTHAHAVQFVDWVIEEFGLAPADRLSNHAPFHFDLSVLDLWGALGCGACVCLLDRATANFPAAVAGWIADHAISVWYSVPSALVRLLPAFEAAPERFATLRWVLFAGEPMPVAALLRLRACLPRAGFANLYGPTETNVCAFYRVPPVPWPVPDPLPIGRACPGFVIEILDDAGRPVAGDEIGWLHVRGPGLLAGYWGDAARTAASERWRVRDPRRGPDQPGRQRLYNTGDRARLGADGELYFHGRGDDLVKCRGYRISLVEVQSALLACPGVRQAAVFARPDRDRAEWLHAVVAADAAGFDSARLRAGCAAQLPPYMVPERIDVVGQLPETSTGKVDRARLQRELAAGESESGA